MNLSNVHIEIDPVILERGRRVLLDCCVRSVEEVDHLVYQAEVEGSERYNVCVELEQDGTVLSLDCDCPFDYGPVCKHQAAVLLKLRDQMSTLANHKEVGDVPTRPQKTIQELLEAESKENLVALLLSLMAKSDLVENQVKLYFSKTGGIKELRECRELIRSYIDAHADRHGFVSWRNVNQAVEGTEIVIEKARQAANHNEWIRSVRIHLCIVEEMVDLLQAADDSSGTVGSVIEKSLDHVQEIILQKDIIPHAERETIFHLLLEESKQSRYDGWSDWQLKLLQCASHLAITAPLRKEWEKVASALTSQEKGDSWSGTYLAEQIALMRYHLIQTYESEESARNYLNKHLHFSDFRERAIRDRLESGLYDDAIRLSKEGEKQDQAKRLPGLVSKWKQYRYEAYRRSGQVEMMRKLGQELVVEGDYFYYNQIKETYSTATWPPIYQEILMKLEKESWPRGIYTQILVEEQDHSRLLEYVKKQPAEIERFYQQLIEHYPLAVIELFQKHIMARADQSNTRKHYQDVCRIIRLLQKVSGKQEGINIARTILVKYPNRPALRDELSKITD